MSLISEKGQMTTLFVNGRRVDFGLMKLLRFAIELHRRTDLSDLQKDRLYARAYRRTINRRRYLRRVYRRAGR